MVYFFKSYSYMYYLSSKFNHTYIFAVSASGRACTALWCSAHSLATHPSSCSRVLRPSAMRVWERPISRSSSRRRGSGTWEA
jgi:hypothetical protein